MIDQRKKNEFTIVANGLYWPGMKNVCENVTPPDQEEVAVAKAYIQRHCLPSDRPHPRRSYGTKHDIERATGSYISNGACIKAFVEMGYHITPIDVGSPNCRINYTNMIKQGKPDE